VNAASSASAPLYLITGTRYTYLYERASKATQVTAASRRARHRGLSHDPGGRSSLVGAVRRQRFIIVAAHSSAPQAPCARTVRGRGGDGGSDDGGFRSGAAERLRCGPRSAVFLRTPANSRAGAR